MRRIKFCSLAVLFAAPALAQTNATFLLLSSNTVSPTTPTTTIEVWAVWDDPGSLFFFGGSGYDLTAGDGEFVSGTLVLGYDPPNTMGVLSGRTVTGAAMGQIWTGSFGWLLIGTPTLLATYRWTTLDFSARTVDLFTSNTSVSSSPIGTRGTLSTCSRLSLPPARG